MITPLTEVGLFCYFIFILFFLFWFFVLVFFLEGGGYLGGWELTNTVLDPGFVERGGCEAAGSSSCF